MKNLLLLLILANVLYFLWGMLGTEESTPGVAVVKEAELGPPLQVTGRQGADAMTSMGAVLGTGDASDLEAVVGRSCISIGPFTVKGDADSSVLEYSADGMEAAIREARGQIFIGHSVQVQSVASREEGRAILETLAEEGLSDAFIVGSEEVGFSIALGIFGNLANAERVELQAASAGFDVRIEPMMQDDDVYFVDIGLPPGRGAGAIIERYGEDQVALREAATCPP
ncbi:MAG: hypothetical protein QNJ11_17155 [Woeseiaceae bacterium]|nr:hypothetical protein [Woeseiaceae bacterium]